MSWATPRDWVTGEIVTSTIMNAHVRDELKALGQVASKPAARVSNSTNGNPSNNTVTAHAFDSEHYDYDNMHSAGNPTRLTCQTAGRYTFGGGVEYVANAVGQRSLILRITFAVGGTKTIMKQTVDACAAGSTQLACGGVPWPMSVGDYCELQVFQNSGGALNTFAFDAYTPEFWAELVAFT